jgi:hypothetical protein
VCRTSQASRQKVCPLSVGASHSQHLASAQPYSYSYSMYIPKVRPVGINPHNSPRHVRMYFYNPTHSHSASCIHTYILLHTPACLPLAPRNPDHPFKTTCPSAALHVFSAAFRNVLVPFRTSPAPYMHLPCRLYIVLQPSFGPSKVAWADRCVA